MSSDTAAPQRQMTPIQEGEAESNGSESDHYLQPSEPEPDVNVSSDEEFLHDGVNLYRAALNGDWGTVEYLWMVSPTWISARITKGGETVLHIAAAAKHVHLVKELVYIMPVDALAMTNKIGNTALCFAAVSGVVEVAQVMVEKNKALPNIRGSEGMTALHMAVLLGHRRMVEYLLGVTDAELLSEQDHIELLTSSIETDLLDVALCILQSNPKLALFRDGKEETALHALARKPLKPGDHHFSMRRSFYIPFVGRVTQDTLREPQAALKLTQALWNEIIKQRYEDISKLIGHPWRLLFVAAQLGKVEFLMVLMNSYPDIIWKVDENRYSIFHIAIIHRYDHIFKLIYEIGAIKDLIATYKDDEGNNMLHLAAKLAPPTRLHCVSGAALQMQREIQWFEAVKKVVRPEYHEAENVHHKTPQALFSEEHEQLRMNGETWMKKTAESCALVATLIATMVFTAAFQLPGGFNSNTGSPVLVRSATFVLFSMSNAISLFTSTASILMFLSILTSRYAERDFLVSLPLKLMSGLILLLISIASMIVAFTATFFITFKEGTSWAPIPIALIACIPVTLFTFQQFPLLMDIYHSTYKSKSMFQADKPMLFKFAPQQDLDSPSHDHIHVSDETNSQYPTLTFAYLHPKASMAKTSHYLSLKRHIPSMIVNPAASASRTSEYGTSTDNDQTSIEPFP